jgi:tripartite-type tricarboxylate transporter receptor subunit TctC
VHVTRRSLLQFGTTTLWAAEAAARPHVYPSSPVRLVVGFPPGGPTDITARLVGRALSSRFTVQFVIENRPGASSNIATAHVAHGPPDGRMLLLLTTSNAINATLYHNLDFDFARDIAPVASLVRYPFVMVVATSVPASTVPEFISYAKANPGKLTIGSGGTGSPFHIAGELFKMMTGLDMLHVPYSGSAPMLAAMLAGQVQVGFDAISSTISYIQAGKLRALGVTTAKRSATLPAVPTIDEFLPGYEASGWQGIGAPKDTPARILGSLNREVNAVLTGSQLQMQFAQIGGTVFAQSQGAFRRFLVAEIEKWARVVKFARLRTG